jgi:hypothetical protein
MLKLLKHPTGISGLELKNFFHFEMSKIFGKSCKFYNFFFIMQYIVHRYWEFIVVMFLLDEFSGKTGRKLTGGLGNTEQNTNLTRLKIYLV